MTVVVDHLGFADVKLGALGATLPAPQRDMLIVLMHQHPGTLYRKEMMLAGMFFEDVQGRVGAYACFEYAVLQLQRALQPYGWRLDDTSELYRLIKT